MSIIMVIAATIGSAALDGREPLPLRRGPALQESVVFEQIGRMAGATSYVHVHIAISLLSIEAHIVRYLDFLETNFGEVQKAMDYLQQGHNNTFYKTKYPSHNDFARFVGQWVEIAHHHRRETFDMLVQISTLRNIMPDIPETAYRKIKKLDEDEAVKAFSRPNLIMEHALRTTTPAFVTEISADQARFHRAAESNISTTTTSTTEPPTSSGSRDTLPPESLTNRVFRSFLVGKTMRGKRAAGLVALPLAVAATAMGLYNTAQIEFLKNELADVRDNTKRIFEVLQEYERDIRVIYEGFKQIQSALSSMVALNPAIFDARLSRIESQIRRRLEMATHGIQAALQRRLSADYLSSDQVREVFANVQDRAHELECELLIQHHSDLYQLETSLLFDGDDIHILVHVPMVPKHAMFRLFRLYPFPLPLIDDYHLIPMVKNDILAISSMDTRYNVELSVQDLTGCHHVNKIYMCSNFGVMSKRFDTSCLGSLYVQDFERAQALCKFEVVPVEERIYQLRKNWFVVYSPTAYTVPIRCRNGTMHEAHLKRGMERVHISPGCEGSFVNHTVLSDFTIRLDSEIITYDWTWEPLEFMPPEQVSVLTDTIQELQRLGVNRPSFSELQYTSRTDSGIRSYAGVSSTITLVVAGCSLVGLGIGFCWFCRRRSIRRSARLARENAAAGTESSGFHRMPTLVNNFFHQLTPRSQRRNTIHAVRPSVVRFSASQEAANIEPYASLQRRVHHEVAYASAPTRDPDSAESGHPDRTDNDDDDRHLKRTLDRMTIYESM
jgi:hypothetical protein